jgi:hypothetical protein
MLGEGSSENFLINCTAFIGPNLIASAIFVFTSDAPGLLAKLGIQLGCYIVLGIFLSGCVVDEEDYSAAINRNYASEVD